MQRGRLKLAVISALAGVSLLGPAFSYGRAQKDPLTDQQADQLRENGTRPLEKLKLYLGFIEERTAEMHRLNAAGGVESQQTQLHNLYEEFTRLSDELEDNMDSFEQQHADMRKILKSVVEKSEKWPEVLNEPKAGDDDEFVRKTALAAGQSVHDAAKQMLEDEEKYFSQHKSSGS